MDSLLNHSRVKKMSLCKKFRSRLLLLSLLVSWSGSSLIYAQSTQNAPTAASGTGDSIRMTAKPTVRPHSILVNSPPMGWNSWDGFGTTIRENDVRANARWLAKHLKPFGWQYIVVDMEWFVTNPIAEGNSKNSLYSLDEKGRYIPPVSRFPEAGSHAGFKPLAEYVHSLGLKFGIHILRGIPKQAVVNMLPIAGSTYHANEAADTSDVCPWNPDNYGMNAAKPAAQAYYDSIAKLYASWGVDLIKVDCISSHPYKSDDIRMISAALRKTGRPIVLSLSPGPAPVEKINEMRKYAQMWRISDDIWDLWHSTEPYPQGLGDQFANVAKWSNMAQPGRWPDADMMPLGHLGPAPGWGVPRENRLSHDEQRTLVNLWCIFRSPLMVGGNLPADDAWTLSLLTNPEVLAVDQYSSSSRVVVQTDQDVVWVAKSQRPNTQYVAVFNIGSTSRTIEYSWKELGLTGTKYRIRDLWLHKKFVPPIAGSPASGAATSLKVELASHASVMLRVIPTGNASH